MNQAVTRDKLNQLIAAWIGEGKRVIGPAKTKPDLVLYKPIASSDELTWDGFIRPANSIKEFIFRRHEKLFGYRLNGKGVELYETPPDAAEQIIVGARPCDAAALPILDHVFNWDFEDDFYNHYRKLTTIVTLACREHDEHCFCTAVGLGPADESGSDVMLFDLGDGGYEVRCLTDKGRALFAGRTTPSDKAGKAGPGPTRQFDLDAVKRFVDGGFESPLWQSLTMRCLGCGACAYSCPTCHCFDIVDEGNAAGGLRVRNWDYCQATMFTLHASGHNPRTIQGQRQRQRIAHKFRIYPDKFGVLLCTGCGNCSRNCPVSLGVGPVIEAIPEIAAAETIEATK